MGGGGIVSAISEIHTYMLFGGTLPTCLKNVIA